MDTTQLKADIHFLNTLSDIERQKCIVILEKSLNQIDLDSMKLIGRLTVLCQLIDICREMDVCKEIIDVILKRWDPSQDIAGKDIDPDGIIGDLSATYLCSMENLKYLTSIYDICTPMTILDSHIRTRTDSGMIFNIVANRILKAYEIDNLEESEWEQLVKAAEDTQVLKSKQHTFEILSYINDKVKDQDKLIEADKPEWVNIMPGESEEFFSRFSLGPQKDKIKENAETISEFLKLVESEVTVEEAMGLSLSLSLNEDSDENQIERLYGPANAIVGFDCISKPYTHSRENGPCRMLTCICKEDEDDMEDDLTEEVIENPWNLWFKGHCEICKRKIRKFRHAVRLPLTGGGFIGCFCSFDCVLKSERVVTEYDECRVQEIERLITESGICDL